MASTSSLIDSLVADLGPVHHRAPLPALALGLGIGGTATLMVVLTHFGVQDGLAGPGLPPI